MWIRRRFPVTFPSIPGLFSGTGFRAVFSLDRLPCLTFGRTAPIIAVSTEKPVWNRPPSATWNPTIFPNVFVAPLPISVLSVVDVHTRSFTSRQRRKTPVRYLSRLGEFGVRRSRPTRRQPYDGRSPWNKKPKNTTGTTFWYEKYIGRLTSRTVFVPALFIPTRRSPRNWMRAEKPTARLRNLARSHGRPDVLCGAASRARTFAPNGTRQGIRRRSRKTPSSGRLPADSSSDLHRKAFMIVSHPDRAALWQLGRGGRDYNNNE